nr:DUF1343 domain-containing protein [Nitrospinaceae bacterium]NIR53587.1 DUF1343 domain-containing protein [Nitrospinaceae bacterium]NIS83988.1 DUF1343 domain-containing protein [Nitrospinaceae bacterium]NIT80797.1 DUF1343 domain-containing protein [Nitrospinaceae bacterium]NIU43103.1 DUF1343 domain-containing protein [Nitrospinaceae bacterium]
RTIAKTFPDVFEWRTEPYEFVTNRPAIDLLYGHPEFRETLLPRYRDWIEIKDSWRMDQENFEAVRNNFLLY